MYIVKQIGTCAVVTVVADNCVEIVAVSGLFWCPLGCYFDNCRFGFKG